jgi:hypothetical protein
MIVVQRVSELTAHVRNQGFRSVASQLFEIVRNRMISPWHVLYWMPVAQAPDPPNQSAVELRVVRKLDELNPNEQRALEHSVGASAIPIFERRLSQGIELHILFVGERIAGTMFFVFGRYHCFQHVVLTEHDAMGLDGRVDSEFRGRGLFPVFLLLSIASLKQRGIDRLFIDCSEHNERSIRSFSHVGFRFLLRYRLKWSRYRFDRKPV